MYKEKTMPGGDFSDFRGNMLGMKRNKEKLPKKTHKNNSKKTGLVG